MNKTSIARLEELLISQYNQEFSELTLEEKTKMLIEDKRFLKIANEVVLQNGHYLLKLPIRKPNNGLPNNRQMALLLQSLKTKMKSNEQFKQEYIAGVSKVFFW